MRRLLLGSLLIMVMIIPVFSQSITIKGTVTDLETGEALPGVNIVIEGTFIGSITDINGNYYLDVTNEEATLVYSFIGMNTVKEKINGRSIIDVALGSDAEILGDVMVVAYGTTTKEAFTGAAEVVGEDVLKERPVSSFEKALQGTTAGLQVSSSSGQPGSASTVRIRGIGSLSSSSSPLYVIDGVPMSGSITDINPSDIANLTVLKDAAAASLYGSRAANGVIIITTKSGSEGVTKITFDAQYGVSNRISDGYQLMNSTQFYEHSWLGLYNQQINDGQTIEDAKAYAHKEVKNIVGFNPFSSDNPLDENGKLANGVKALTDTDWRDAVYKTGAIQNYNLSVSGGNDDTKVYFSLGYLGDSGTTLSSNFKRYSGKVNVSHKVNSFLTAGINNHLSYSTTEAPPSGSGGSNPVRSAEIINAASPIYNADESYNWENKAVYDFNPVGLSELDKYSYITKRALINAYLNFAITPTLNFRTTGAIDYSDNDGVNHYNPYHGNGAGVNGRTSESRSDNMAWNITNLLTWNKARDNSSFEAMLGQEAHGEKYSVLSAGATDFAIPGHHELVWGGQPEMPSSYSSEWRMVSYFGQAKYNYGGRYYLSASLRGDGCSRFGEDYKYGLFYSVGGSWRITEEEWMPELFWLNNLKIRASYGTSGNSNLGNYASLGLYGSGANYGGYPGLTPVQLENNEIKWEKIQSLNIGLETRLFNRLGASVEYYTRYSDGLLYGKPLSAGLGFPTIMTNLGAMENRGVELSLNWDVLTNRDLSWVLGFNMSTNINEIKSLATEQVISGTKIWEVGGDVYQFYMRDWAGVDPSNGNPMWFTNVASDDASNNTEPNSAFIDPNGSGKMVTSNYMDAERIRKGSALPDLFGGLSNNFNYRNFDLSFYFYYSIGGQIYNFDYAANMHDGNSPAYNLSVDALDAWTPSNKYTNVPRYNTNNENQSEQMSSRYLEDGSFLRLKNVSFGYYLPESICQRVHVNQLKVFVSAENLWTLTKYKGFDPEGAMNGTTSNTIPGVKTISFGVKMEL